MFTLYNICKDASISLLEVKWLSIRSEYISDDLVRLFHIPFVEMLLNARICCKDCNIRTPECYQKN